MIRLSISTVGAVLRRLRHSANLSQRQLGSFVALSVPGISKIESGQRDTTVSVLVRWVEACDATLVVVADKVRQVDVTGLSDADVALLRDLSIALPALDPLQREMLNVQVQYVRRVAEQRAGGGMRSEGGEKKQLA